MNNSNVNYCLFIGGIVVAVIVFIWLANNKQTQHKDSFTLDKTPVVIKSEQCRIDSDCPGDNFCYYGKCWGYWKGYNMPWSTCKNPYCTAVQDPLTGANNISCGSSSSQCLPYCKCKLNRRPGGTLGMQCFPKCGDACVSNDECPPGCPMCKYGKCSAP